MRFGKRLFFPLCGFYASAIARVLHHFDLRADAQVSECRAAGGRKGCLLSVVVLGRERRPARRGGVTNKKRKRWLAPFRGKVPATFLWRSLRSRRWESSRHRAAGARGPDPRRPV